MRHLIVGTALLSATVGCGPDGVKPDTSPKAVLLDLAEALKSAAGDKTKPPAKLAELDKIEPMMPLAGPAIRSGEVVYLWGAGYDASGTQVVAYEKKAETEGGAVLLQNGTVETMTAEQLKAAPKAGKK
jgi:hypothetical protein